MALGYDEPQQDVRRQQHYERGSYNSRRSSKSGETESLGDFLGRYGGMHRMHRHWSFQPSVPPPPNPMRFQHRPQNIFGQEVCEMCDWNAELRIQRDDWVDKILLELLAQDFSPVLSTEGWMMQSSSAMTTVPSQVPSQVDLPALCQNTTTKAELVTWLEPWPPGTWSCAA